MSSEESPLLSTPPTDDHELVYRRFSPFYKKIIVAIVSWCALLPLFITGAFYPSIPQIARDLDTTGQDASFAVSVSVLSASIGAVLSASYSTFYGRKYIYLVSLPLCAIGSLGVATAQNLSQLLFWRVWQCLGASPGLAVGAGVIGDIYKLEERGTWIGIFFAGSLLGFALAPAVGGFVAQYASWRFMQFYLACAGLLSFLCIFLILPETSHPGSRGIDKLRLTGRTKQTWKYVNPLATLTLLRSATIVLVSIAGFFVFITHYVLLVPLAFTILRDQAKRYHIDQNEAIIGACYIPVGLGDMFGALLAGRISDEIIIKWRRKRGGVWYPEDRLRAAYLGGLVFAPLSVLGCGFMTEFIEGRAGLMLNLIFLFMNGLGLDMFASPIAAYVVDITHSRSAEAMACNQGLMAFLSTFAIAGVMPMINTYGMLVTNIIAACSAWIGYGLLVVTVRYGDQMRA